MSKRYMIGLDDPADSNIHVTDSWLVMRWWKRWLGFRSWLQFMPRRVWVIEAANKGEWE